MVFNVYIKGWGDGQYEGMGGVDFWCIVKPFSLSKAAIMVTLPRHTNITLLGWVG